MCPERQGCDPATGECKLLSPCSPYGDVDNDGWITEADGTMTGRIVVGLITPTPEQERRADVTNDGAVTTSDTVKILRYVQGLDDTFPVCGELPAPELDVVGTITMFSIPLDPGTGYAYSFDPAAANNRLTTDCNVNGVAYWDPSAFEYIYYMKEPTETFHNNLNDLIMQQGQGYWIKYTPSGCAISAQGYDFSLANTLEAGRWYQIAIGNTEMLVNELQGCENKEIYWYNPSTKLYEQYEATSTLRTWEGYWIRVNTGCMLEVTTSGDPEVLINSPTQLP